MSSVRAIFPRCHLGTQPVRPGLLDFLREHESEYLFLLSDIVDFWAMKRSVQWAPATTPWCRRCCAAPATAAR